MKAKNTIPQLGDMLECGHLNTEGYMVNTALETECYECNWGDTIMDMAALGEVQLILDDSDLRDSTGALRFVIAYMKPSRVSPRIDIWFNGPGGLGGAEPKLWWGVTYDGSLTRCKRTNKALYRGEVRL